MLHLSIKVLNVILSFTEGVLGFRHRVFYLLWLGQKIQAITAQIDQLFRNVGLMASAERCSLEYFQRVYRGQILYLEYTLIEELLRTRDHLRHEYWRTWLRYDSQSATYICYRKELYLNRQKEYTL